MKNHHLRPRQRLDFGKLYTILEHRNKTERGMRKVGSIRKKAEEKPPGKSENFPRRPGKFTRKFATQQTGARNKKDYTDFLNSMSKSDIDNLILTITKHRNATCQTKQSEKLDFLIETSISPCQIRFNFKHFFFSN